MAYNSSIYNKLKKLVTEGNTKEFIKTFNSIRGEDHKVISEYLYGKHDQGCSLLSWACMEENTGQIITHLINKVGLDIDHTDAKGRTALYMAVDRGMINNVRLLIKNDANIDSADYLGDTPLHVAAEPNDNSEELIELLCAAGAKFTSNKSGATPFHIAAKHNIKAMHTLVEHRGQEIDINAQNDNGDTALHCAAESETGYNSTYLLKLGASRTIKNDEGETAAQVATNWDPEGVDWQAIIGYQRDGITAEEFYTQVAGENGDYELA